MKPVTDTEKKIADIREALEKIDRGFLLAELCELEEENRKLRERLKEEIVWQDECLKLEEQLQSAHQEIERLREENEGRKKIIEAYMRIEHDLAEDAERYLQQRDKLIEGLRWYADAVNYRREFRSRHGTLVEPAEAIYYDSGQRARNILREIGVTVE